MSRGDRQGWFADPYGLHEQRYFSADWPTKLVRDGTVEGFDELPSEIYQPAVAISAEAGAEDLAYSGYRPRRRGPGFTTWYLITLVAVAAVVAVIVVAVRHAAETARAVANARDIAYISQSAQRTLAERSAHATISGSVHVGTQTFTISGSGEVDFSTGATAQTMHMSVDGQQLVEKTITTRGHLYYTIIVNGTDLMRRLDAADWLEASVPRPSSESLTGSDPRAAMMLLKHGDDVRALGTKQLGGVPCTGYAVTPSRQAMAAAAGKEISALKLSPSEADLARSIAPPTITVWVDAHGVLHQVSVGLQIGALASGTASGVVTETLSDYGAPVHIKAPPARDVISLKKYMQRWANDNGAKSVPWTATSS